MYSSSTILIDISRTISLTSQRIVVKRFCAGNEREKGEEFSERSGQVVSRGQSGAALRRRWTVKRGIYGASRGEDNIAIVQVVRMHARQRDKSRDEKGNPRGLRRGGDGGSRNSFKVHARIRVEANAAAANGATL